VRPGSYLKVGPDGVAEREWWNLADQRSRHFKSTESWQDECMELLDSAVSLRLVSDVPFGAFLSGGVDSSTIVGLMSKHLANPVKTFTIGFSDPRFDESSYARLASERFSTDHVCEIVNYDIVSDWDNFIRYCDQPHGDVSFMPMRKVAEVAARDVKMVLTGDGADELFAGYDKYVPLLGKESTIGRADFIEQYLPYIELFDRAQLQRLWRPEIAKRIDETCVDGMLFHAISRVEHFDDVNKALYLDMCFLLSGNNLVKPDRMAMSHSLETRAPFLDHRVMEFAFQTPGGMKLRGSDKKHYLKKAVAPLIGQELAYRKKQMFTMPIGEWFRNELRQYCGEMLLAQTSRVNEIFEPIVIDELLTDHLSGKRNRTREIRALISIELWLRQVC
jgi:asparagine synthase (glutamine-hydrolysing)